MSKKIIKPVLALGAVVAAAVLAPVLVPAFAFLGPAALAAATAVSGIAVSTGFGLLGKALGLNKRPELSQATRDRLFASMDPIAPRKIVFGRTAMGTDVRYQAYTGGQEYYEQIMVHASHQVEAIEEIWFDSELAWTAAGGAQGRFAGYLTVTPRLVGASTNGIAIDGVWTSSCTLTGCAYSHLKYKLTGNSKKAESPFSQAIPSRVTVRGKGAFLPDVREGIDASAQAAWDWFSDASGRNPALQLLFYLLGWRINGKLALGCGMPADRIDLDSFITAANMCDEPVAKAAGGTEPRYCGDGMFSETDDPETVIATLEACMNGKLDDSGGRLALHIYHNDLAAPVAHFDANDILGDEIWEQTPPLDQVPNLIRGLYSDPGNSALYQLVDYPETKIASLDGIDRIEPITYGHVQSPSQVQRLNKQRLQRHQYQGAYSAILNARAWQVSRLNVVTLSHPTLGWDHKLFRVRRHGIAMDGRVPVLLQEENADLYAWDAEESPAVEAAEPTVYDPTLAPIVRAISDLDAAQGDLADAIAALDAAVDGKVTTFYQSTTPVAEGVGDLWFNTATGKWLRWDGAAWVLTEDSDIGIALLTAAEAGEAADAAQATADGKVTTFYQDATPSAEGVGDLWVKISEDPKKIRRWSGSAWVEQATFGATTAQIALINDALSDAANAQATADGKIDSFYQASAPSGATVGDLWFDTDDGNKAYRHSGSGWVAVQDTAIGAALTAAAGAQATADGKVTTFYQDATPVAEGVGDLWTRPSDSPKVLKRWDGDSWEVVANNVTQGADIGVANGAGTTIDLAAFVGTMEIAGNKATGTTSGPLGATPLAKTAERYKGPVIATARLSAVNTAIGASSRNAPASYSEVDFLLFAEPAGYNVYSDGAVVQSLPATFTPGDVAQVVLDEVDARFFLNGEEIATPMPLTPGQAWRGIVAANPGASLAADFKPGAVAAAPGAGTTVHLASIVGTLSIAGNKATGRITGTAGATPLAKTLERLKGPVIATGQLSGGGSGIGISSLPAPSAFVDADLLLWARADAATYEIYQDGVVIQSLANTHTDGDIAQIINDEVEARFYLNGDEIGTPVPVTAEQSWRAIGAANPEKTVIVDFKPGSNKTEVNADITSSIDGLSEIIVQADHTGAPLSGQLPLSELYRLRKNGIALTSGVTWTYEVLSGALNGFTSSSGAQSLAGSGSATFTVSSLSTDEASVMLKAAEGSRSRTKVIRVAKDKAAAPTNGSAGGGTAAADYSFSDFSSSTMVVISDELIVTVGTSGSVALSASLSITGTASGAGTTAGAEAFAIFQWWNGSAWADIGTETASDPDLQMINEGFWYASISGQIGISTSKSGLTAGSSQKFRVMARKSASASAQITTLHATGSASAQG